MSRVTISPFKGFFFSLSCKFLKIRWLQWNLFYGRTTLIFIFGTKSTRAFEFSHWRRYHSLKSFFYCESTSQVFKIDACKSTYLGRIPLAPSFLVQKPHAANSFSDRCNNYIFYHSLNSCLRKNPTRAKANFQLLNLATIDSCSAIIKIKNHALPPQLTLLLSSFSKSFYFPTPQNSHRWLQPILVRKPHASDAFSLTKFISPVLFMPSKKSFLFHAPQRRSFSVL